MEKLHKVGKMQVAEVKLGYKSEVPFNERTKIIGASSVVEILRSVFAEDEIEHCEKFYALYANRNMQVLGVLLIGEGGTSSVIVDTKKIFQGALLLNASNVILCHNHPSGNRQPSREDIALTKKVVEAGRLFDIDVCDHIILTSDGYTSLNDSGDM